MQIMRFWMHKIIRLNYIIFTIVVNYGFQLSENFHPTWWQDVPPCATLLFAFQDEKIQKVSYHFVVHSKMYILIGTIHSNRGASMVLTFWYR